LPEELVDDLAKAVIAPVVMVRSFDLDRDVVVAVALPLSEVLGYL